MKKKLGLSSFSSMMCIVVLCIGCQKKSSKEDVVAQTVLIFDVLTPVKAIGEARNHLLLEAYTDAYDSGVPDSDKVKDLVEIDEKFNIELGEALSLLPTIPDVVTSTNLKKVLSEYIELMKESQEEFRPLITALKDGELSQGEKDRIVNLSETVKSLKSFDAHWSKTQIELYEEYDFKESEWNSLVESALVK